MINDLDMLKQIMVKDFDDFSDHIVKFSNYSLVARKSCKGTVHGSPVLV